MAATMRSPPKLGLTTIRARISCIRANISSSVELRVLRDAVERERLRGAAATLIECGDESLARPDLFELLLVHEHSLDVPTRVCTTLRPRSDPPPRSARFGHLEGREGPVGPAHGSREADGPTVCWP